MKNWKAIVKIAIAVLIALLGARLRTGDDVTQAPLESHPAGPFLWDWREIQNLYCFAVDANSAALLKFVEGTLQGIFLDAEMIG